MEGLCRPIWTEEAQFLGQQGIILDKGSADNADDQAVYLGENRRR
jgi:hypothetical protein